MTTAISDKILLFRIYVANGAPNSRLALQNLTRLCSQMLSSGSYELEIVDVLEQPSLALRDNIIVTPTLIRMAPNPVVRITGNLSDTSRVISALGLEKILKKEGSCDEG